ncbi:MAG TPA: hypothetical protein PKV43_13455, partial [Armatimonadota bacterium]|nr:hypothetical protein [Armatimonadota bacterium]
MGYDVMQTDSAYELESSQVLDTQLTSRKFVNLVVEVHERMLEQMDAAEIQELSEEQRLRRAREVLSGLLKDENLPLPARVRQQIAEEAIAEISGYGPIQPLLDDSTVTEIMVNGPDLVYIERDGKLYKQDRV